VEQSGPYPDKETLQQIAERHNLPWVDLSEIEIPQEVIDLISLNDAVEGVVFPLGIENDALKLAICIPSNTDTIQKIESIVGKKVMPFLASPESITLRIDEYYIRNNKESLPPIEIDPKARYTAPRPSEPVIATFHLDRWLRKSTPPQRLWGLVILMSIKDNATHVWFDRKRETGKELGYCCDGVNVDMVPPPAHLPLVTTMSELLTPRSFCNLYGILRKKNPPVYQSGYVRVTFCQKQVTVYIKITVNREQAHVFIEFQPEPTIRRMAYASLRLFMLSSKSKEML